MIADPATPRGAIRRRATVQSAAIREALMKQDGFRSVQDVYAVLRSSGHKIGLSTVYRHLQAWSDQGVVDQIHGPSGETSYRFCGNTETRAHHHHLVCRRCGRAEEVEGRAVERWASETARRFGYTEVDHTVEIFGRCAECAAAGLD